VVHVVSSPHKPLQNVNRAIHTPVEMSASTTVTEASPATIITKASSRPSSPSTPPPTISKLRTHLESLIHIARLLLARPTTPCSNPYSYSCPTPPLLPLHRYTKVQERIKHLFEQNSDLKGNVELQLEIGVMKTILRMV
jgi:hypothetical protein